MPLWMRIAVYSRTCSHFPPSNHSWITSPPPQRFLLSNKNPVRFLGTDSLLQSTNSKEGRVPLLLDITWCTWFWQPRWQPTCNHRGKQTNTLRRAEQGNIKSCWVNQPCLQTSHYMRYIFLLFKPIKTFWRLNYPNAVWSPFQSSYLRQFTDSVLHIWKGSWEPLGKKPSVTW